MLILARRADPALRFVRAPVGKVSDLKCTRCGSPKVSYIFYGLPNAKDRQPQVERKFDLGGCGIVPGAPIWRCEECGCEGGRLKFDG